METSSDPLVSLSQKFIQEKGDLVKDYDNQIRTVLANNNCKPLINNPFADTTLCFHAYLTPGPTTNVECLFSREGREVKVKASAEIENTHKAFEMLKKAIENAEDGNKDLIKN